MDESVIKRIAKDTAERMSEIFREDIRAMSEGIDMRFEAVNRRLDAIDARLDRVELALSELIRELRDHHNRIEALEKENGSLRARVSELETQLATH